MNPATMYRVIQAYLERIPGAMKEVDTIAGHKAKRCVYRPLCVVKTL